MGQTIYEKKSDTRWVVLTGAPSSGKTTIINILKERGYKTVDETAREIIYEEMRKGLSIDDIRRDERKFQTKILFRQIEKELELDPNEFYILDRGILDTIAFMKVILGIDPSFIIRTIKIPLVSRYSQVFLLEFPGEVESDGIRKEDRITCKVIEREIENLYKSLGYNVIRIPPVPNNREIERRVDLIVKYLEQ